MLSTPLLKGCGQLCSELFCVSLPAPTWTVGAANYCCWGQLQGNFPGDVTSEEEQEGQQQKLPVLDDIFIKVREKHLIALYPHFQNP